MLAAGALFTALYAAAEPIAEVRIEQLGGRKVPEDQLRFQLRQKAGADFDPQAASEDVKRLYNTGLANTVSHTLSRDPAKGLILTYTVNLKPTVSKIVFDGNRKFTERELLGQLTFFAGEPLNDKLLTESANKLRSLYFDDGYYQATVQPLIDTAEDGSIVVTFKIDERLREKLDHVTFENNTVYSGLKLRYSIANQPWPVINRLFDFGLLNKSEIDADKARLRTLYWEKGYLDFTVKDVTVTPDPEDPEYVNLNFVLDEGVPYTVTGTAFSGNSVFTAEELAPLVVLAADKVFNSLDEDASVKNILDYYGSFGYADANVKATRRPNFQNKTLDVVFEITEGRKYKIDKIDITGNKLTKEKVIRRELAVMEGDPLDTGRVEASRQRLLGMGYFSKVEATTQAGLDQNSRRVVFDVEEKDPYSFRIGGGFSDSDSLAGMMEFSNNNFDITNPRDLFRGGGQRFRIQAIVGTERYNFNVDFTEPWLFDQPLRYDVSGYGNYVEYQHWDEERIGIKNSLTRRIFEFIDPFNTATVGYKFEYVGVRGIAKDASAYLRSLGTFDLVSEFSAMLNRDTRDNLLDPTSGYQTSLLGAVSPKGLGSTESFYRVEARGSYYTNFLDKALIWHLGAHAGAIDTFNGSEVPLYERYFLGGGESLRGFPYREVSPVDSNGYNIGGNSMFVVTTEITHPIWSFIRGAVFCDAGNVWGDAYNFNMHGINVGAGYGLRIKVPMLNAPVRLDLAYPIVNNQDDLDSKLRFHFNMGFTW